MKVAGVGMITGWGRGVEALPADAAAAADGRYVVAIPRPAAPGDRLRRATRECLLGIGAVEELLRMEVAIEYGLCGAYVNFIGGAAATVDALWYAGSLLERGACTQALVLAVETFAECADLYRRARWLAVGPLVEAAACALLRPGGGRAEYDPDPVGVDRARRRTGQTFACEPLIALAVAGGDPAAVAGRWRGRPAGLRRL